MQALLPPECDILCSHPGIWPGDAVLAAGRGLTFMYEAVRVTDSPACQARLAAFLAFWRAQGCRMVEMTCEEHDRQAASTQFITHAVWAHAGGHER